MNDSNDAEPLVSVVVPVFNRAHLVDRSIASLCLQDYRNLEIIVVDDASSDDLEGALSAMGDARIRLVRRERNGGAAAARNDGMDAAQGEFVAFADSDDICLFNRIRRQVLALKENPALIGVYSSRLFHSELGEKDYRRMRSYVRPAAHVHPLSGDLAAATLRGNLINLPTLMVRRSALEKAGMFDPLLRNNEDWDYMLRLTPEGPIGFIADPLLITPNPISSANSRSRISRSTRASTRSFVRITGKLRRAGQEGPELVGHYRTTARFLVQEGRARAARRFMCRALRLQPVYPRLWLLYALTATPRLYTEFRRWYRARRFRKRT